MKHERFISCLWAVVLSLCAAVGGIGCVCSGFSLQDVSFATLLVSWLLAAAVFSLCFTYKRGAYPLIGLGLLGGYLWYKGPLELSCERLLRDISQIYHNAYNCGTVRWSEEALYDVTATTALCWLGLLVVICVVATVVSRRSVWLGVGVSVLPMISCLVVTDTVPGELWLFLLLFAVAMLLLTQTVRHREAAQANKLSLLLALPVVLALGLLFLLVPREGYTGQAGAAKLEDLVLQLFSVEKTPQVSPPQVVLPTPSGELAEDVRLTNIGPKTENHVLVMRIRAPVSGTVYLRGFSYDTYTGTSWESTVKKEDGSHWPRRGDLRYIGQISISTVTTHNVRYTPYYPSNAEWYKDLWDGALENTGRLREYTVDWAVPENSRDYYGRVSAGGYGSDTDIYLTLPDQTRAWATMLAAQILREDLPLTGSSVTQEKVAAIAEFVRSSAYYSLATPRMEDGYEDFAQWFLEQSDTGYCVHFASAATVLLRAAGIPARYVTGYMVQVGAEEYTPVRGMHAHAWVEYCLPGGVWQILDATPAATDLPDPTVDTTAPIDFTEQTDPTATDPSATRPEIPTEAPTLPPHNPEEPSAGTTPGSTAGTPEPPDEDSAALLPPWLGKVLSALLMILVGALAVIGQWRLRVHHRWKRQHRGRANRRALTRWRDVVLMSKLLGKPPEAALHTLAQKARFSQHTLKPEELLMLDQGLTSLRSELKKRRGPVQLLYTLVLALY